MAEDMASEVAAGEVVAGATGVEEEVPGTGTRVVAAAMVADTPTATTMEVPLPASPLPHTPSISSCEPVSFSGVPLVVGPLAFHQKRDSCRFQGATPVAEEARITMTLGTTVEASPTTAP